MCYIWQVSYFPNLFSIHVDEISLRSGTCSQKHTHVGRTVKVKGSNPHVPHFVKKGGDAAKE